MPHADTPTVRELRVRAVRVPMPEPHRTASGVVSESPLVLTDIVTDGGATGRSLLFTYTSAALGPATDLVRNLAPLVVGQPVAPAELEQQLARRFRLLGTQGLVGMALAAIDMALWDALARAHGLPLVRLLGRAPKPVPCYGPVGFDGAEGSARAAARWAGRGFTGVKAKIGYATVQEDVAVIRAIRAAVGPGVSVMVDYNQSLTPTEAVGGCGYSTERGSPGSRSRRSPTTTPGTRGSPARPARRSRPGRTGGGRSTSATPSRPGRATCSCRTP